MISMGTGSWWVNSNTKHRVPLTQPQNKNLTGNTEAILVLQGIGWLTRKAIGMSTITLHIKEYTDEQGQLKIDIEQTGTGGMKGTTELRTLNWQWGEHKDGIFGAVKGRSRMLKLTELADDTTPDAEDRKWLSEGWEDAAGDFIQSWAESVTNGWNANQVCVRGRPADRTKHRLIPR